MIKDKFKVSPFKIKAGGFSPQVSDETFFFQGFNDGLEELCKIQKGWAIPDKDQRHFIRQAQKTVVSEAYRTFVLR